MYISRIGNSRGVWEKIPGHERNEALDCRNYALAAFKALPVDLDAIDRRLKAARGEGAPAPVVTPQAAQIAKGKPRKRVSEPDFGKYYDNW